MVINKELKAYLDKNIVPLYHKNDKGHSTDHLEYVLKRASEFSKDLDINNNILYTAVVFHDVGHHIDRKNHEVISAEIMEEDVFINVFFDKDEIKLIKEAILDHRASSNNEPRSIYGKLVSTADRNVSLASTIKRTYEYRKNEISDQKKLIEESFDHVKNKFGPNGYAREKSYFNDENYNKFLNEVDYIIKNYDEFEKMYKTINKLS